jgi:hypothetical protein
LNASYVLKGTVVTGGKVSFPLEESGELFQLGATKSGVEIGQAIIIADMIVAVFPLVKGDGHFIGRDDAGMTNS